MWDCAERVAMRVTTESMEACVSDVVQLVGVIE